jgi:hypothetical protein
MSSQLSVKTEVVSPIFHLPPSVISSPITPLNTPQMENPNVADQQRRLPLPSLQTLHLGPQIPSNQARQFHSEPIRQLQAPFQMNQGESYPEHLALTECGSETTYDHRDWPPHSSDERVNISARLGQYRKETKSWKRLYFEVQDELSKTKTELAANRDVFHAFQGVVNAIQRSCDIYDICQCEHQRQVPIGHERHFIH